MTLSPFVLWPSLAQSTESWVQKSDERQQELLLRTGFSYLLPCYIMQTHNELCRLENKNHSPPVVGTFFAEVLGRASIAVTQQ